MSDAMQHNLRPRRQEAPAHLFAIGQLVRLRAHSKMSAKTAETYRVTARLPPVDNTLQYRLRSENETHERVAKEDTLEAVGASAAGDDATLIERTFGDGQERGGVSRTA